VLLDFDHYPVAIERPGAGDVIGEVVWVRPAAWPAVLGELDHLEGYDPTEPRRLFDRVVRRVETAEGPVECWVYLAGRTLSGSLFRPVVAHGDWVAHRGPPAGEEGPDRAPPGRDVQAGAANVTRWYPRSALLWAWPAIIIGLVSFSVPVTVVIGGLGTVRLWAELARP